jgi:predicted permease
VVQPSSWIIVASWIVAIVSTVVAFAISLVLARRWLRVDPSANGQPNGEQQSMRLEKRRLA